MKPPADSMAAISIARLNAKTNPTSIPWTTSPASSRGSEGTCCP